MPTPLRVLIAGCGDIGTRLGHLLHHAGHTVFGLRRGIGKTPSDFPILEADLTDPKSLSGLPDGVEAVIYSAAAAEFSSAAYHAAYVSGVETLIAALKAQHQPIRRLIFTSSTSVYGQNTGEWVDEQSPAEATGFSAEALRAGERAVWDSGFHNTVVRFGGIYGEGRTRLVDSVREGSARLPVGEPFYTNRIHQEDVACVLAHLLLLEHPAPLYVAVDDHPAPLGEVLLWMADQLQCGPLPVASHIPIKPGAEGRREVALRQRANKRCRNRLLRDSGFDFQYPSYREGYATLINPIS